MKTLVAIRIDYEDCCLIWVQVYKQGALGDRLCLSVEAGGLRTQLFPKVFIANMGFISWLCFR